MNTKRGGVHLCVVSPDVHLCELCSAGVNAGYLGLVKFSLFAFPA